MLAMVVTGAHFDFENLAEMATIDTKCILSNNN
jgi:hypothetical protein